MNWINVNDELPPSNTPILLYNSAQLQCVVGYYGNGIFDYSSLLYGTNKDYLQHKSDCMVTSILTDRITHWMPLPENPIK